MNRVMVLALFVIRYVPLVEACAPTDPGGNPGNPGGPGRPSTTTTTLPPCCREDIFDMGASTGRALFNPVLTRCPDSANFICSVRDDLVTDPTMIVLNGGKTIATGDNGTNSFIQLTCRSTDKVWVTPSGDVVDKISCLNGPAGGKKRK